MKTGDTPCRSRSRICVLNGARKEFRVKTGDTPYRSRSRICVLSGAKKEFKLNYQHLLRSSLSLIGEVLHGTHLHFGTPAVLF